MSRTRHQTPVGAVAERHNVRMLVVLPLKESGVDSVDVKVRVVGQRDQRLYVVALLDYDT